MSVTIKELLQFIVCRSYKSCDILSQLNNIYIREKFTSIKTHKKKKISLTLHIMNFETKNQLY